MLYCIVIIKVSHIVIVKCKVAYKLALGQESGIIVDNYVFIRALQGIVV
jgi:hypothetical protein